MSNKIAIYTVCTRGKDTLSDPVRVTLGCDYFCFTDTQRRFLHYRSVLIPPESCNAHGGWISYIKIARKFKILPHLIPELQNYDTWIWIDSNIQQIKSLTELIELATGYDIAAFTHGFHKTVFDELKTLEKLRNHNEVFEKDPNIGDVEPIREGMEFIKATGIGLTEFFWTGILIRQNNEKIRKAMESWHNFIEKYSHRDQPWFPYIVDKFDLKMKSLSAMPDGGYTKDPNFNRYFQYNFHQR